jgi:hypothetical protein
MSAKTKPSMTGSRSRSNSSSPGQQAPLLRLEPGTAVVRNQVAHTPVDALGAQPACPVERVRTGHPERWRVPHIVQVRRRDQRHPVLTGEHAGDLFGPASDRLDVKESASDVG